MYNEPSLINCRGFHQIPPVCGFALWGAIGGLISNQQDLLAFLNMGYRRLDDDYHSPVEEILNDPPGYPSDGDRYIVGCSPSGAWVGQEGNIAEWKATAFWGGARPEGSWENTPCGAFGYTKDDDFDSSWESGGQWAFTEPEQGSVTFVKEDSFGMTFLGASQGEGGGGDGGGGNAI